MFPIEALIDQGDKALADGLTDVALKFYQRALHEHGDNHIAYEKLGSLYLNDPKPQQGVNEAIDCFTKSLELNPQSISSHLNLAQLSSGKDALAYYQNALTLAQDDDLKIQVYCSMCEIYLTDCCHDADAEAQIETFLTCMTKINPNHHQYLITAASTRISQFKQQDAKEHLNLFFKNLSRDFESIPDYDCRISAIRLCIETQLYDHALDLLELNLQIDEDDGETWYLFGWIYFLLVNDGQIEYEADMLECWDKLCLLQEKNGNIDPDLIEHVKQLRVSRQGQ